MRLFIDLVLSLVGVVYLGYFALRLVNDLDGFFTRETAEDFLVGPSLTLALIPFMYAVAWLAQREQRALDRTIRSRPDANDAHSTQRMGCADAPACGARKNALLGQ